MNILRTFALAACAAMVAGGTAAAADTLVTAKDPQGVVSALKELGYVGELTKAESGRTSINVTISGVHTFIDFYDCAKDLTDCYTLLFTVGLDLKDGTTLEKANEWNTNEIVGRVWLDRDRDPTLDFSLSTFDGVPSGVFADTVKMWDRKIGDLKDFFDF